MLDEKEKEKISKTLQMMQELFNMNQIDPQTRINCCLNMIYHVFMMLEYNENLVKEIIEEVKNSLSKIVAKEEIKMEWKTTK
jgi:hypothetical protein